MVGQMGSHQLGMCARKRAADLRAFARRSLAPNLLALLAILGVSKAALEQSLGLTLAAAGVEGRGARPVRIALTREKGQNRKLREALDKKFAANALEPEAVELIEIPCIEHGEGEDFALLRSHLQDAAASKAAFPADAIILTSPEGARVFLRALEDTAEAALASPAPIATVGRGTSAVLQQAGLEVAFEPSTANAETLAAELPEHLGPKVAYVASAIAPGTLQDGLKSRGLETLRFNSYTTRAVQDMSKAAIELMEGTNVATFGSPSAVRAWKKHCPECQPVAACIGGTSRHAAEEAGFQHVTAPEKPGVPGWADVTASAALSLLAGRSGGK